MSYICETIIITKSDFFWKKSRFHWNLSPKPEAGNIFQVLAVTKRSMPDSSIPFSNNSASIKWCSLHRKPRQQKNIIKIFLIFAMLFEKVCAVKPPLIPTFHSSSGCKTKYCWKIHWFKALSSFTLLAIKKEKSTHKAQLPACALTFCPLNILYYIPGWLIHNTYLIKPQCRVEMLIFPYHNHKLMTLLSIGFKVFCQLIFFRTRLSSRSEVWVRGIFFALLTCFNSFLFDQQTVNNLLLCPTCPPRFLH